MFITTDQQHMHDQQIPVAAHREESYNCMIPPPYRGHAASPPQHMYGDNYQGTGTSSYTPTSKYMDF